MGSFNEGHGDVLRGNRCLVGLSTGSYAFNDDRPTSSTMQVRENLLREKYGYNSSSTDDESPFVGRLWGGCEDSHVTLESNEYYTPDGIAMVVCNGDDFHKLEEMGPNFGLEVNSTVSVLPDVKTILTWAEAATQHDVPSSTFLQNDVTS